VNHPLRLLQAFTLFCAGLFALFVFAGNLMDYGSNYDFVKHVLSMDDTFDGNQLMWRAITSPVIHTIAYIGIIIAEGAFALIAIVGSVKLFLRRNASVAFYNRARGWGYAAYALGFGIWYIGFVVVGSEWFAMWQSETWNGKDTAMGIVTLWAGLAVLLALNEPSEVSRKSDVTARDTEHVA
jgi:predicted small integral membrane protein